jgi:hypothetical protein
MFPVMNNLEMNSAKEKLKKTHFRGGGFHAVLETYYVYKYFKYFKICYNFKSFSSPSSFDEKKPQLFASSVG